MNAEQTTVKKERLGKEQNREKYSTEGRGRERMRFPVLKKGRRRKIETSPFSFAEQQLANAKDIPIDVHIELQRWLRKIYLEFRELDLRILLADLQSSMKL